MNDPNLLSVVIPAYNEERTIDELLDRVQAVDLSRLGLEKDVIVVDDGSRDGTAQIVAGRRDVRLLCHERNYGKGAAIRRAVAVARGRYAIIQDADLEYDPRDYVRMLERLLEVGDDPVYGSRYLTEPGAGTRAGWFTGRRKRLSPLAYLGSRSLSLIGFAATGHYLTDTTTALKLFRTNVLRSLALESDGFETDHEITAKVLARGLRIHEVAVGYSPRDHAEGKKTRAGDWIKAARTYRRYRRG